MIKRILIALQIISVAYLVWFYKDAGNMRDAGVYFDSGIAVLKGENPYECCSRWGSFGPVPFSAVMSIVPLVIRASVIRVLSILGIYLFFRMIFPNKRSIEPLIIFLIVIWTSPVRELLVTNQMTGITMGLLGLGIWLYKNIEARELISFSKLLSAIPFAMAIDMKPHLTAIFFITWVVAKRRPDVFVNTVIVLVFTHMAINVSQNRILELDWLTRIQKLNSMASDNSLGDSLSFWPILNHYLSQPKLLHSISLTVTILLACVCLFLAVKRREYETYYLSFFVPATSIYFHFYDAIPLVLFAIVLILKLKNTFFSGMVLSFYLVPLIFQSVRNQALVVSMGILVASWLYFQSTEKSAYKIVSGIISGFAAAFLLHVFNLQLDLNEHLLQSMMVTQCLILSLILFWISKKEKVNLL